MKHLYLFFLFVGIFFHSFAQTPGVNWSRAIGGSSEDYGYDVQNTIDGGFLVTSEVYSQNKDVQGNHGEKDLWIFKTNKDGAIEWKKCLGGSGTEGFRKVIYHNDGSALIVAISNSVNGDVSGNHGLNDIWLAKIDKNGNILWERSFGGTQAEEFRSIDVLGDNSYILAGYTRSNDGNVSGNHGGEDIWVVRIGQDGTMIWQKCLGGLGIERPRFIKSLADGSFLMIGSSDSNDGDVIGSHGNNDVWVVRLSANGTVIWQKTYGGSNHDTGFKAVIGKDGEIVVLANTFSNDGDVTGLHSSTFTDVWILKLNYSNGSIIWQKCIGGTNTEVPKDIIADADGSFMMASETSSKDWDAISNHSFSTDVLLVKLTNTGNILWARCYGGSGGESLNKLIPDSFSNTYYLSITTNSSNGDVQGFHQRTDTAYGGQSDAWFVNIDKNGVLQWQRTLGGYNNDILHDLQRIDAQNFILVGQTNSNSGDIDSTKGGSDTWLIKLGPINTIKGAVYYDRNSNGIKDVNEKWADNLLVTSSKSNFARSSIIKNGQFKIEADTGAYTTSIRLNSPYYTVLPASINSTFTSYFLTDSIGFALQPVAGKKDLSVDIVPLNVARPGFTTTYKVCYKNVGTTSVSNGTIIVKRDTRLVFLSSSPAITVSSGDTLKWAYSNLNPGDTASITIQFRVQPPPVVTINDTLTSIAIITPVAGDETPNDDTAYLKQRVIGSYDPNDKYENHAGRVTREEINGKYLNYTIRFQNTGTDTAFTVVIRDTLDTKLDWNTLEMVANSHPYSISITNGNKLAWKFSDILLPHSAVNEPASHGYLTYRIKPGSNIAVGDTIKNSASIYFDYNLPIVTNTEKTLVVAKGINNIQLDTIPAKTIGDPPFNLALNSSAGLPIKYTVVSGKATVSGNRVTLTGAGKVTIRAEQEGNNFYEPAAPVTKTFCVNPREPDSISGQGNTCTVEQLYTVKRESGITYIWSVTGGSLKTKGDSAWVQWQQAGMNRLMVQTSVEGCLGGTLMTLITVNPMPAKPTVKTSGPTQFCEGDSVILSTTASGILQWYRNDTLVNGASLQTFKADKNGSYKLMVSQNGCSAMSDTLLVKVNPTSAAPTITVSGSTTFCTGESVLLTSSFSSAYQWYKNGQIIAGATKPSFKATESGTYTVKESSSCSVPSAAVTVVVKAVPAKPRITASGVTELCQGNDVRLSSSFATGNQWYRNDTLINGATNTNYTASAPGTYTVKVSEDGCFSSFSETITVTRFTPVDTITSTSLVICPGSGTTLAISGGSSYQWYLNGIAISGATNASYNATNPGNYNVDVISAAGCQNKAANTVTLNVTEIPAPNFSFGTYCKDLPVQFINNSALNDGDIQWFWQFGDNTTSTEKSPVHTYNVDGIFSVRLVATSVKCPSAADTIVKTISIEKPIAGIKYSPVEVFLYKPQQLSARNIGKHYLWTPPTDLDNPNSRTPVVSASAEQEYIIRITSASGCITVDTLKLSIDNHSAVFVPKAFTPDRNGANDVLRPILVNVVSIKYFRVFNRWGQLLFETKLMNEGWDGTYKGVMQPVETYTWGFEGTSREGKPIKAAGKALLVR